MSTLLSLEELAKRELPALCDFAANAQVSAGFGYLGPDGRILAEYGAQLWINCRMTHMFSLFALAGINPQTGSSSRELAAHGIQAISEYFADKVNGGWFSWIETELDATGNSQINLIRGPRKEAYAHAFVIIAASSASVAGIPGAAELLTQAREIQDCYWWDESAGRVRESYAADWSDLEVYRGANANMHTFESCLAAFDATGDQEYLRRGASIAQKVINESARERDWRIPEHFTSCWQVNDEYNRNKPTDPFRPWGATPGHGFEWSRLCLQLLATVEDSGINPVTAFGFDLDWIGDAAVGLYRQAWGAWGADGDAGIVYTTDFAGVAISRQRMHWVLCEAIGASLALQKYFGKNSHFAAADGGALETPNGTDLVELAGKNLELASVYVQRNLIEAPGRWYHELDVHNFPAALTWPGKADIYHAGQAMFLVNLPLTPSFAQALAQLSTGPKALSCRD